MLYTEHTGRFRRHTHGMVTQQTRESVIESFLDFDRMLSATSTSLVSQLTHEPGSGTVMVFTVLARSHRLLITTI
jgi:hypothetical protein